MKKEGEYTPTRSDAEYTSDDDIRTHFVLIQPGEEGGSARFYNVGRFDRPNSGLFHVCVALVHRVLGQTHHLG